MQSIIKANTTQKQWMFSHTDSDDKLKTEINTDWSLTKIDLNCLSSGFNISSKDFSPTDNFNLLYSVSSSTL